MKARCNRLTRFTAGLLLAVLVLLTGMFLSTVTATETAPQSVLSEDAQKKEAKIEWQPPASQKTAQQRVADIQTELDLYLQRKDVMMGEDSVEFENLRRVGVALGALQDIYSRYSTALDNLERAKREADEAAKTNGDSPVKEVPPYNLSFYEEVRNRYETVEQRLNSVLSSIRLVEGTMGTVREQIVRAEERAKVIQDDISARGSTEEEALQLREAEAELETARMTFVVQTINLEAHTTRKNFLERQKKALENALNKIRTNLRFDEADRDKQIAMLGDQITKAREQLSALQGEREKLRINLVRSQGELNSARSERERAVARATVTEREAWLNYNQAAIAHTEQELSFLEETRKIWEVRYGLIQGTVKGQALWDYRSSVNARMKDLENVFQVHQSSLGSIQSDIAVAQKELEAAGKNTAVASHVRGRIEALNKTAELANATVSRMFSLFNQYSRLHEEINAQIDAVRIAEKVTRYGMDRFLAFWNVSLWSGEGFDVTIAKLVLALFLFAAAFLLSGRFTDFVGRKLLLRFDMDVSARIATQKILFYVFMLSFILSALDLVGIPLTAFSFLGGALAIGIGFGAQNFFNNLISGFILMVTKPIRMDDTIEIDGLFATVEEIGSRSTRLKTFDNIDVLMPNSYFLNNKIINWTHTDQKIRLKVNVGVAYGTDVREVERLLLKAANDHSRVLKSPEPYVIFRDFGPSSLDFTLFFWLDMTTASTIKVTSDLRYRLVALFEDNNITIAFPQMDIHLNAVKPITVDMTRRSKERDITRQEE